MDYIVEYKGIGNGKYEIDYHIDKVFFSQIEDAQFSDGNVEVKVFMTVFSGGLEFEFRISGTLKTECDRCLEEFDMPIKGKFNMSVKFAEKASEPEDADEEICLSLEDTSIDLKQHIYEFVVLSAPLRHLHKEKDCNKEILKAINSINEVSEDDNEIDPRWEKLKSLL